MSALPWYAVAGLVAVAYAVAVGLALALARANALGDRWRDGADGADEPADVEQEAVERLAEWARKESVL